MLITIALVAKIFNSAIPRFLIYSWILLFISIVFGIIAEINEVIFYSNLGLSESKKRKEYKKLLSKGQEIPYLPEHDTGLIYNDIWWGVIAIGSFVLAVLCMCAALLEKTMPHVSAAYIMIPGVVFIVIVTIYLIWKRKTA